MSTTSYRNFFPIYNKKPDIHYLDSAATTQKPEAVINALNEYYTTINGNAGRGSHTFAIESELAIEKTRAAVKKFTNCTSDYEVVFTKNATESLNIIASCFAQNYLAKDDEIILSINNHHANIVPWQIVAQKVDARLRYAGFNFDGSFNFQEYIQCFSPRTKLVCFSGVVNADGIINPSQEIIDYAHKKNALVVLDAAQSIAHTRQNIESLNPDFLVFSGHKLFSAFGVGVLIAKKEHLAQMPAFLYGGEMIDSVDLEKSTFKNAPQRFEGGTQDSAAIYSLHAAIDFVEKIGYENTEAHIKKISDYALEKLKINNNIELYHTEAKQRTGIIAFNVKKVHSHDTAYILNEKNVMVRSGHHCTMPFMTKMQLNSNCRASFQIYNEQDDVDALIDGLEKVIKIFGGM